MSNERYNESVRFSDEAFRSWCEKEGIPLHGIHHVITWEPWDDGIGVYFFLDHIADVERLSEDQRDAMRRSYLGFLREHGYPFDKFPKVVFEIDSDENVRKQYDGSYFFRLR